MKVEKKHSTVFHITLHAYELSALLAAARWVVEGAEGELPEEALDQLRQVVDSYDAERRRITES